MGAWIEILGSNAGAMGIRVAPLVGAWIEIRCNPYPYTPLDVAPLVGAWIEIHFGVEQVATTLRRSPRGSVD